MTNELQTMLKDLNIYNNPDGGFNPDFQQLNMIYEKFCSMINYNENFKIENQQLNLFYRCKLMCRTVGILDFQLQDIIDPDMKRLRHILNQLCKYCYWRKDQLTKWEARINEIIELVNKRQQKQECEDFIQHSMQDLDLRREQFEQLKQQKYQLQDELNKKQLINNKLTNTTHSEKMEFDDLKQRIQNLLEKQNLYNNELIMLETQIVKDPKNLEQKLKESQKRIQGLELELEKLGKEKKLEDFKISLYKRFKDECEQIQNKLTIEQQTQFQIEDIINQISQQKEQLFQLQNQQSRLQINIEKMQEEKKNLIQQKLKQEQLDQTQNQQSLLQLTDLQNQLLELEQQYKREKENLGQVKNERSQLQQQLQEAEIEKEKIELNIQQIIKEQLNEAQLQTETIIKMIRNIQF